MTVDNDVNRKDYDPDGIVAIFPYDFRVDDADDLVVYEDGVVVVGGYTVSGVGEAAGGDVTFDVAPLDSVDVLTLIREVPLTQETAYPALGPFPASSHEGALDKLTFIAQQQQEEIDRALIAPVDSDPATDYTLPNYEAGKGLVWSEAEQKLENSVDVINDILENATAGTEVSSTFLSYYGGSLANAVANIGSLNPTHLIVNVTPDDLTEDLVITDNITIQWRAGYLLGGAFTLAIEGALQAGEYPLFDTSLTRVDLTLSPTAELKDIWWYDFSEDWTVATQAMIDSCTDTNITSNKTLLKTPGDLTISTQIDFGAKTNNITLKTYGNSLWSSNPGAEESRYVWSGANADAIMRVYASNRFTCENIGFVGNTKGLVIGKVNAAAAGSTRWPTVKSCGFEDQIEIGVQFGYDVGVTTQDDDYTHPTVKGCRFSSSSVGCIGVFANIQTNGYFLHIEKDNWFLTDQAVVVGSFNDITIKELLTNGSNAANTEYYIDIQSGGGYFDIDKIYCESVDNLRLISVKSWSKGTLQSGKISNTEVNSALNEGDGGDYYVIDCDPTVILENVKVSNGVSGGTYQRAIKTGGHVALLTESGDDYSDSNSVSMILQRLGLYEFNRLKPSGEFVSRDGGNFDAGDYTASGSMTWTVATGDVDSYRYTLMNKTCTVDFYINTTTVAGTPSTQLQLNLPSEVVANKNSAAIVRIVNDGTASAGYARINAGDSILRIEKIDASAWSASTDNTGVYGSITFNIE